MSEYRPEDLGALIERAARHPLLSAAEEAEMAARIERGDPRARDRMIECNIRLVISLARPYRGRGVPLSDLVQEGMIGRIAPAGKSDAGGGLGFWPTERGGFRTRRLGRLLADGP